MLMFCSNYIHFYSIALLQLLVAHVFDVLMCLKECYCSEKPFHCPENFTVAFMHL